jgi:hypothetical protein
MNRIRVIETRGLGDRTEQATRDMSTTATSELVRYSTWFKSPSWAQASGLAKVTETDLNLLLELQRDPLMRSISVRGSLGSTETERLPLGSMQPWTSIGANGLSAEVVRLRVDPSSMTMK